MKFFFLLTLVLFQFQLLSQLTTDSIFVENHYRSFHFNNMPVKKKSSLLFVLHGSGGNGLQLMNATRKLEAKKETENILIVYPDGYKHFWNECRKASTAEANQLNINEQAFFENMISYFEKKYGIDKKKVFVIGYSGGGHMAFKLAQTIPEKISGICTIVANLPDSGNNDCTIIKKPIAVMMVNGTADNVSPYAGGKMNTIGVSLGNVQSVENTFKYWSTVNGYSGFPAHQLDTTIHNDSIYNEYFSHSNKKKPPVILYKVNGGKHEFPKHFDVFEAAWTFFKKETRRKLIKTKV